jgi:hypothetical protein
MLRNRRGVVTVAVITVVAAATLWLARDRFGGGSADIAEAEVEASSREPLSADKRKVSNEERATTIARAQVWRTPAVPIARSGFSGAEIIKTLSCKFKLTELGGTTPKFDCIVEDGQEIRIKYGKGPEIPAELAATRLLRALGFGADDVTLIEKLRCYGCPEEPFSTMKVVEVTGAEPVYRTVIDYDEFEEFEWVALERKFNARPIETEKLEGWSFFELDSVDATKGGAPRAHVDALRLLAVFIAHWDNKSENQRIVCLSREWSKTSPCAKPFLLLQDVGATFGPAKVDLEAWEKSAIWADRPPCRISMRDLPYNGATFTDVQVTEAGRQFAGKLLSELSDRQISELFSGARFDQKRGIFSAAKPVGDWVRAFKAKVQAITDGSACPVA